MDHDAKIKDKDPEQDVLLAEYQAAQSSAEHHDRLVWTVSSIVWAGSLALMGIILKSPTEGLGGSIIKIFLCFLGILLSLFVWDLQEEFSQLKKQKYDRCRQIEEVVKMKHHLAIEYEEGSQTWKYSVIMRLFLVAWGFVAMSVLCNAF